jgi:multidrug efflux pump subunit AcrA (membrane-fusion protein)
MPVTAKLSLKFYEKLGEDVATELVNWFNEVDATYRPDLKELNEANFARFEPKLDQRTAQLDAKIDQRTAQLDAKIEQRTAQIEAKLDQRIAELRVAMQTGFADLRQQIAGVQAELIKWTFVFWLGTIGLVLLLLRFPGGST